MALHHVSLEVPADDAGRSLEFWEALGFRRVQAPDEIAPYVTWVEHRATQIHLIHTPKPTVPVLGHAAVVTPDIDAAMERLRGSGFEVEENRRLWGERRAIATAPGGHRVELMAAPPPATPASG